MTAMAGAAVQWSCRLCRLVHVRNLLDVVLLQVLGHGVHDAGHVLLRFRVVVKLQARTAIGTEVIWIRGMAVIAMRAEGACPSFHDVVNLVTGQVLWKYFQVFGRGEVAGRSTGSRWRALRCLSNCGDREYCAGKQGDRDGGRGQGSNFQALSSRREIGCFQMDEILMNKDAPANADY